MCWCVMVYKFLIEFVIMNQLKIKRLVSELVTNGVLKSKSIEQALRAVDRMDFIPEGLSTLAYEDEALPIGYGQTISQPYTVVFMLELLELKEGQRVMDVGYGSGWQTALLSYLVGKQGSVYAFEIIEELCKFGKNNIEKYPALAGKISLFCKSADTELTDCGIGSLDRIIVAADIKRVPQSWRDKLVTGGIMVYPHEGSIYKEIKNPDGAFTKSEFSSFVFVPFVQD